MSNETLYKTIGELTVEVRTLKEEMTKLNRKLYSVDTEISQLHITKARTIAFIFGICSASSVTTLGLGQLLKLIL